MSARNRLPAPTPARYDPEYQRRLLEALRQQFDLVLSTETANTSLLLRSPGGKVYEITVSDAGALTATYVQG
jgi:hypothetical protein